MDIWAIGWTVLVLLLLRLVYRYIMKPYTYWKERGVPSVPGLPIIGSLKSNFTKPIHEVVAERYRKYGRIYGLYESNRPVISVGEPDLLKDIFLKDFNIFTERRDLGAGDPIAQKMVTAAKGEEWKRIRTIITPAFSSGKIKKMSSIMRESAMTTAKNFEKYAESGKPADFKRLLGAFTMDVIAKAAFGTDLDSHNNPDNEFVKNARAVFERGVSLKFILFFLFPGILKIFRTGVAPSKPTAFLKDIALDILKHRRESGQVQNDFLQLLMEANDEMQRNTASASDKQDADETADKTLQDLEQDEQTQRVLKPGKKYKMLTHDEIIAQCILFLLAGYETTASTLSFACYLLALNPECQEKLIKEVDDVFKTTQGDLTYDVVQHMKYLETVILETLRIYPPASLTVRTASEDYKLGNTGIVIPRGMLVQIPIFAIHHDSEFYEDPEKFNPDRFNPEEKSQRHPYTYLPFGAGPRNCIGMRFAMIEIKFCLTVLLSRFRFKRCSQTKVPLEFQKGTPVSQAKGIDLVIEKRKDMLDFI